MGHPSPKKVDKGWIKVTYGHPNVKNFSPNVVGRKKHSLDLHEYQYCSLAGILWLKDQNCHLCPTLILHLEMGH
jgi:hypothetical protein